MSLCDNAEAMAKKHSPSREQERASGHSAPATHQVPVHVGIEPGRVSPAGGQDDFQRLVDRLRAGRVVLCAGSSLGRGQAPGRLTFTGVLGRLLEEVARQGGDAAEVAAVRGLVDAQPLAVAGFIRRQLGEGFADALATAVKSAPGELPESLTLCGQLPLRSVVTTLLDGSLVQSLSQAVGAAGTPARSFTAHSAAQAREAQQDGRSRYVLQLFGDATTGEGLVFSESELQRTLADEPLHQLLQDLYSKRSFLFVGFDPREPELQLLLTRALSGIRGVEPSQHFAVLPGLPRGLQKELGAAHGLTVLDGDELTVLRALREAIGDQVGEALPDDEDLEGWLRVLQHEPSRQDAQDKLAALEQKLGERGEADRLIELWLGRLEVAATPAARASCLRQAAEIFERQKGQVAEAFQALLAAYKEAPSEALREAPGASILDELERLAGASGQWLELLHELREQVPLIPVGERAEVLLRIARLYGDKLHHSDYALASLGEVQKLDPKDPGIRRRLYTLRIDLTRRAEKWKELAESLGQLAALLGDGEKDQQLDLYLEQGEIYEARLSDGVSAAAAFKKAQKADPQSRDVLAALEHVLRRHASWTDLITLLDDKALLLEKAEDPAAALRAQREAAQLFTEHGGDRKAAISRWETLRQKAPTELDGLRALEKLYSQEGNLSEKYLGVVSALADNVPSDKERLTLYRRLVAEYEELPGHGAQAVACLEKIVLLDPAADDAYRGLERHYQKDKSWPLLIDAYKRHAEHATSGRAELLSALAKVMEVELPAGDPEQARLQAPAALQAWQRVLEVDPENTAAIEGVARLSQISDSHEDAIKMLLRRAHLTDDKPSKVALYGEAARLSASKLGDKVAAEEHYVRALEIDAQHIGTIVALAELYRGRSEFQRAAKLYCEAEQYSQNRLDKTRYLVEAGKQYLAIDDRIKALELFQRALSIDPEQVDAAQHTVDLLLAEPRPKEALPILEMLARKEAERPLQVVRLCRLGQTALVCGQVDKARRSYRRAVDLAPTDLPALRGLIPLLFESGQFVDAKHAAQTALSEHRDGMGAAEKTELLGILGACERALGHEAAALDALREALAIDPLHRGSLQTLRHIESLAPTEKLEHRQALLRALMGAAASGEANVTGERMKVLTELGDLYSGPLGSPQEGIAYYKEALQLQPDSLTILHKLLAVYSDNKLWSEAADILDTLAQGEKNDRRRARFKHTAALIYREELRLLPRALALFHGALDDDPSLTPCLEAVEELAVELDDPRELIKAYQRKINSLGPKGSDTPKARAERLRLWTEISKLCIQRLGDLDTGTSAFEVTLDLDPQNLDRHRQLASIYASAGGDRLDKAIREHQLILARNKSELGSYKALKDLYAQTAQREKSAAVAYALHLLRKADPEDERLVEELRARPLQPAKRPISKELWRMLSHPEEDLRLGALFQAVLPVVQAGHGKPWSALGLLRRDRVEPSSGEFYAKALRYGIEMMDSLMPEVYPRPQLAELHEQPFRVSVAVDGERAAGSAPPVVCLELGAPLLNPRRPEREVLYEIGRVAALLRPERAIRAVYATAAPLALLIEAAVRLGDKDGAKLNDSAPGKLGETMAGLRRALPPAVLEQVQQIGRALGSGLTSEAAATAWLGYSDLTAVRAGLVLCGDLETAALLLATDPPGVTPLTPKQRLIDLIHFTVTEEFFTVRQHLGL